MKTKNNVQKAILKSMAMGISLVLITLTVNAQDFWKSILENASINEIALAMVETSNEIETTEPTENFNFILLETENEQAQLLLIILNLVHLERYVTWSIVFGSQT